MVARTKTLLATIKRENVSDGDAQVATLRNMALFKHKRVKVRFGSLYITALNPAKIRKSFYQLYKVVECQVIVPSDNDHRWEAAKASPNQVTCCNSRQDYSHQLVQKMTTVFSKFGTRCSLPRELSTIEFLSEYALQQWEQSTNDWGALTPPTSLS